MDKSEIKAATIHELGVRFEDMLEAAKHEEVRNEGAKSALFHAARKVSELQGQIDRDMDAGQFGELDGPLSVATLIKKYISRACVVLEQGASAAEHQRLMQQGKGQAFQQMIDNMKKLHDVEMSKVQARKLFEAGESSARPVGVEPDLPLKEKRKLEALVEAKVDAAVTAQSDEKPEAPEEPIDAPDAEVISSLEAESEQENVPIEGLGPKRRGKRGKNS